MTFEYSIKAIPTTYAGVNFRSRLEARWAAFFDLSGWKWDYEPFDLEGWAPDFLIMSRLCDVLVEVKPIHIERVVGHPDILAFEKARNFRRRHQILLLGICPVERSDVPGSLLDPPDMATYSWDDIAREMEPSIWDRATGEIADQEARWREAGNKVQWIIEQQDAPISVKALVNKAMATRIARGIDA